MILKQFYDPTSSTLTYILARKKNAEALIIDPVQDKVDEYLKFLGQHNLRLIKAIDTHIHADHISGLAKLRDLTLCMTIMGEEANTTLVSQRVQDGDVIKIDGIQLKALYTPGHTEESYCFFMDGFLFTGDTLFIRGNGRTDFQNGDPGQLYDSITRLFEFPDSTVVYPGHDYKAENVSTIGREKIDNKRYYNKTREEFIEIMNKLDLPNPKMMDIAIPANQALGEDIHGGIAKEMILSAEQAKAKVDATFVDLRGDDEIQKTGKIDSGIHVSYEKLATTIQDENSELGSLLRQKKPIVFYCAYGERSALALMLAREKGFENIFHLNGGIYAWLDKDYDIV